MSETANNKELLKGALEGKDNLEKYLEDMLGDIKKKFAPENIGKLSTDQIENTYDLLNDIKSKKEALEKEKGQNTELTKVQLNNLKEEIEIQQEIEKQLQNLDIKLNEKTTLKDDNGYPTDIFFYLRKTPGNSFLLEVRGDKIRKAINCTDIQTAKNEIEKFKSQKGKGYTYEDLVKHTNKYYPNVSKDFEKQYSKDFSNKLSYFFKNYLLLKEDQFDSINISSFINTFSKVDGNNKDDWKKAGYEADGIFGGEELDELNALKEKYSTDGNFKLKIDQIKKLSKIQNYYALDSFIKERGKEGFNRKFEDSSYEEGLDVTDIKSVLNFMSDFDADGKHETLNMEKRTWYTLWIGKKDVQGQAISETKFKDALHSRFKSLTSLNIFLRKHGINEVTPKTTQDEMEDIKDRMYQEIIQLMNILGNNKELDGFHQILDGNEAQFLAKRLRYEEKLESDIDKILDSKETEDQINEKIKKLKNRYLVEDVEDTDDLERVKKLLKAEIKGTPSLHFGLLGGIISSSGEKPNSGDIVGKMINSLSMRDYRGVIGFYVSKRIYQSDDRMGSINLGVANFVPYVSANYAMTVGDNNEQEISTVREISGNLTVVPGIHLSPLTAGGYIEVNPNDKNRAIEREIYKVEQILSNFSINDQGKLIVDRKKIDKDFNPDNKEEIKENLDKLEATVKRYYEILKTDNKANNEKLLNKLIAGTINFFTDSVYAKNKGVNFSGITFGAMISLFNPASWAGFIGLNFQYRDQEFIDNDGDLKSEKLAVGKFDEKEVNMTDIKKLGFEKKSVIIEGKTYEALHYTGPIKNFYAPSDVQIQILGDQVYLAGNIKSIHFAEKITTNYSGETAYFINGAKYGDRNYQNKISSNLELPKIEVTEKTNPVALNIETDLDSFSDREKVKKLVNGETPDKANIENKDRYKKSFLLFQQKVAEMFETGDIDSAWKQLGVFIKELNSQKMTNMLDYYNSVDDNYYAKKQLTMLSIIGDTAGDWRVRFYNELKGDSEWAQKNRKKLFWKGRKDFAMKDITDGGEDIIDHTKEAEYANFEKYTPNFDLAYFKSHQNSYDKTHGVKEQRNGKEVSLRDNALVFVNFTQKNGMGKSTFHQVVPMYGTVELHAGAPELMNDAPFKNDYVDRIPTRVLVSKYLQILNQINSKNSNNPGFNEMKKILNGIKSPEEKAELLRSVLKGDKSVIGLKGSFDLSFVRWSTCQNSAIMIDNMNFELNVPGMPVSKMVTGMPTFSAEKYDESAISRNDVGQVTLGLADFRDKGRNGGTTPGVDDDTTTPGATVTNGNPTSVPDAPTGGPAF